MITVVTGPPCAGKTTYVAEHMKPGDVRLDWDLIQKAIGGDDAPRLTDGTLHQMVFAVRRTIIHNVTQGIWLKKTDDADAWMIHSTISRELLAEYEQAGAEFTLLDPGEETCLQRADRDGDQAEATRQAIRNWYANPPEMPEGTKREKAMITTTKSDRLGRRQLDFHGSLTVRKAVTPEGAEEQPGRIVAVVSVFGNVDRYQEVVAPGAFDETIAQWQASGRSIPMVWSHMWGDPRALIGKWTSARVTDEGLELTGVIDLDRDGTWASMVYDALLDGDLHDFSFAGDVQDGNLIEAADGYIFQITQIDLFEAGPCLIGVNPEAHPVSVKHETPDAAPPGITPPDPAPDAGAPQTGASDTPSEASSMPAAAERAVAQLTAALI